MLRAFRSNAQPMTRDEYERIKARLEEQRQTGIALVESAYQAQIRAVDLVWRLQGEGDGSDLRAVPLPATPAAATREAPPREEKPAHRSAPEVEEDVWEVFPRLPETFTLHDVCALLGYQPARGALYRSLRKLVEEGRTRLKTRGEGHRAAIYQKTGGDGP
jgi:hypothetical protein